MSTKKQRLDYVDLIAPTHIRHSCSDTGKGNYAYSEDDLYGSSCMRCTLLMAATINFNINEGNNNDD